MYGVIWGTSTGATIKGQAIQTDCSCLTSFMLPTITEINSSDLSEHEKHFFKLCLERKIPDWTNRHSLGGFKASVPKVRDVAERLPPDLKIDIIYEDKEKEEDD